MPQCCSLINYFDARDSCQGTFNSYVDWRLAPLSQTTSPRLTSPLWITLMPSNNCVDIWKKIKWVLALEYLIWDFWNTLFSKIVPNFFTSSLSLVAHWFGLVEFWIFVLIFQLHMPEENNNKNSKFDNWHAHVKCHVQVDELART